MLRSLVDLEGIVITVPFQGSLAITEAYLEGKNLKDKAVLFHTGWSQHWNTDTYFEHHPYLTEGAAEYLKNAGAKLAGIDAYNIDDTSQNRRPVHTILLGAEILIVEHMCNLDQLPEEGFTFSAVPPKLKGVGTFPVRAMAKIK